VSHGVLSEERTRSRHHACHRLRCVPVLKNFAALEIGRTFKDIHGRWWITLPGNMTKSRRPDERLVPTWLNRYIDVYLNHRPNALAILMIGASCRRCSSSATRLLCFSSSAIAPTMLSNSPFVSSPDWYGGTGNL
jgi:hypothetical protein